MPNCTPPEIEALAIELAGQDSEVARRAAVNRAYYAAYLAALELAELVPGNEARGAYGLLGHREVPRRLRNWRLLPDKLTRLKRLGNDARLAAAALDAAIDVRELADYALEKDVTASMVTMQLARVRSILNFVTTTQAELRRLCA